jgi:hypothetical protein
MKRSVQPSPVCFGDEIGPASGPIIDQAAKAIAQLLWAAATAAAQIERCPLKRDDCEEPPPQPAKQPPAASLLVDVKRAAEILGVTPQTLAVWRCVGPYSLPYVRIGRCVRYRMDDLDAFVESRRVGTSRSTRTSR